MDFTNKEKRLIKDKLNKLFTTHDNTRMSKDFFNKAEGTIRNNIQTFYTNADFVGSIESLDLELQSLYKYLYEIKAFKDAAEQEIQTLNNTIQEIISEGNEEEINLFLESLPFKNKNKNKEKNKENIKLNAKVKEIEKDIFEMTKECVGKYNEMLKDTKMILFS